MSGNSFFKERLREQHLRETRLQTVEETFSFTVETSVLLFPCNQFMELSSWGSVVRLVTKCVQGKIGQVLGQLPIFTLFRDVFTTTTIEQPKGHLGLNSKAEEKVKV